MLASLGIGLSCCETWVSRLSGPVENILKRVFLMHAYRIFFFSVFNFFINAL
jgi:hypothetical protein